tara:strand:- start:795 stop:1109 length:315 start_codon:yes stop_codon:yes gene_type:complete
MTKRKDLAAALPSDEPADVTPPPIVSNDPPPAKPAGKKARNDRDGMVNIAGWFPLPVKFELEDLRLELSRKQGRKLTLQEIHAEALNDLFKKYGRPELAPTREE